MGAPTRTQAALSLELFGPKHQRRLLQTTSLYHASPCCLVMVSTPKTLYSDDGRLGPCIGSYTWLWFGKPWESLPKLNLSCWLKLNSTIRDVLSGSSIQLYPIHNYPHAFPAMHHCGTLRMRKTRPHHASRCPQVLVETVCTPRCNCLS